MFSIDVTQEDLVFSQLMMEIWTNFAKTGNPNGHNAPDWPIFDENQKFVQKFGNDIETIKSTETVLCSIFSDQVSQ